MYAGNYFQAQLMYLLPWMTHSDLHVPLLPDQTERESAGPQCKCSDAHIYTCRTGTMHPSEPSAGGRPYQSGPSQRSR